MEVVFGNSDVGGRVGGAPRVGCALGAPAGQEQPC